MPIQIGFIAFRSLSVWLKIIGWPTLFFPNTSLWSLSRFVGHEQKKPPIQFLYAIDVNIIPTLPLFSFPLSLCFVIKDSCLKFTTTKMTISYTNAQADTNDIIVILFFHRKCCKKLMRRWLHSSAELLSTSLWSYRATFCPISATTLLPRGLHYYF